MFNKIKFPALLLLLSILVLNTAFGQKPYRVGTTSTNFLELGVGSDGMAMGDAYVAIPGRVSSFYWNPAGLAHLTGGEFLFMQQPWIVDINNIAFAGAYLLPGLGTFSLGISSLDYGNIDVTTMEMQDGTGEQYTASEYFLSLGFARKLAQWFSFGINAKFVSSQIWHMKANAMAVDLGALVSTGFFSLTGKQEDGLNIGMSISNYGTKMKYEGLDQVFPIDVLVDEAGNFKDVPGQFKMTEWELPLIFRIGVSYIPVNNTYNRLTLAVDALHPNNNSESLNVGSEYELKIPGTGSLFARAGYKGIFMDESVYGLTFGGGIKINMLGNTALKIDYAYKDMDVLGNIHVYTFGINF
ncbi:MAG: PorV/PorQ family protein [Candidatus Marinimicrobia bacterium]|nr:PorV/PorQ family protein [Candidatus Neomarinimicrobiota bacterium]